MKSFSLILFSGLAASIGLRDPRLAGPFAPGDPLPARIVANDNRHPAGTLRGGRLELKLDMVNAQWFPEGDSGVSVTMQAFAEDGRAPTVPGPMIRVPEGTEIQITLHNSLDAEVIVHGLHNRPARTDDVVTIPAGATCEVTFQSGIPGTYFYWATRS